MRRLFSGFPAHAQMDKPLILLLALIEHNDLQREFSKAVWPLGVKNFFHPNKGSLILRGACFFKYKSNNINIKLEMKVIMLFTRNTQK
jgi:hypothetical protein